jgi:hypothetical protein
MRKRDIARDTVRESAIGCGTHFLLVVAGVIFLGGAAAYRGWVGKLFFVLAALLVFIGAAAIPSRKRQR